MVDYREVAKQKQAQRESLIPKEWKIEPSKLPGDDVTDVSNFVAESGLLSKKELEIINTPAAELVKSMVAGQLTSLDVTTAFCKSAAVAHQVVNPLTEIMFKDGLARAKEIDAEYAKTKKPLGPLHGLPVSVKDCFNVKGYDATLGFAGKVNNPASSESVSVEILRRAGAVLYVKTNVPHAMLRAETFNYIVGRTLNPYNRKLCAGGSSGGEGALIAMKGSPLGVGTDIGGSIRIPSAFNCQFGLRPSSQRVPLYGGEASLPGQESVLSVAGPQSRCVDSLDLFMKTIIGGKPWLEDPKCINLEWRENVTIPQKLNIGVIEDDGVVTPTPPVSNTLKKFTQVLKDAGHNVIPMPPLDQAYVQAIVDRLFKADGAGIMKQEFARGGEPWPEMLHPYRDSKAIDIPTLWQIQADRTTWTKKILDMWANTASQTANGKPIDCILSPTSAYSAAPHDSAHHFGYTSVWNVADFSAGVFPVTRVTAETAKLPSTFKPKDTDMEKKVYRDYDEKQVVGAPVSLQIICQRLEEEKVIKILGVMSELAKASFKQ